MGIEASAEIQGAARRVLDENRRLRALLHERGVSDTEILLAMGVPNDRPYDQMSASSSLGVMLERRIACNGPACTGSPITGHSSVVRMSSHPPAVPSLSIPVPRSAALSSNDSPSPNSMASSMDTPPAFPGSSFYESPISPAPEIVKTEDVPPYNPYEESFNNSWTAYQNGAHYVSDPVSFYNASSCVDAANIIRTMRGTVGPELENDLGCRVPGQDCYVNNAMVFNVMDKYANPQSV